MWVTNLRHWFAVLFTCLTFSNKFSGFIQRKAYSLKTGLSDFNKARGWELCIFAEFDEYSPVDILNLLSKLTFRRLSNASLVWLSYTWSRIIGKPWHPALPISVSVEPTTSCNLRCPECPSGLRSFTRPTGMLQTESFRRMLDEIHRDVLYLTFYFQESHFWILLFGDGEYGFKEKKCTLLRPLMRIIDDETARRTVESGLDRLIISIDEVRWNVWSSTE